MKFKEMSLRRKRGARVERETETADPSRIQVSTLSVGDAVNGRVISLVPHGCYIDVGGERDVLLHVRDMSVDEVRN